MSRNDKNVGTQICLFKQLIANIGIVAHYLLNCNWHNS